jgi:hypothetical protein
MQTIYNFKKLRDNPPPELRSAFFPLPRGEIKAGMNRSPALFRPILKTDQGPAGNFLGFEISSDAELTLTPSVITTTSGVALAEIYFLEQLPSPLPLNILEELTNVQSLFQQGNEPEAFLALERLQTICENLGITFQRKADKGRLPFFFIRPVAAHEAVKIPSSLVQEIEKEVSRLLNDLTPDLLETILYFQADVIVRGDGSFVIDKMNFPDVGFFLSQIDSSNNDILAGIQELVLKLQNVVGQRIIEELKRRRTNQIYLVTRDEVIYEKEDTLEILEVKALKLFLQQNGCEVQLIPLSAINTIPSSSTILNLNIKPNTPGFDVAIERVKRGEIFCYPDPRILLLAESFHTYPSVTLTNQQITNLAIIVEKSYPNDPNAVFNQLLALQYFLDNLGFSGIDIFYFVTPDGERIPCFRYDPQGFNIALKRLSPQNSFVELRGLPFKPEDALIIGQDGPRLAAFRFMFVKN